jgi:hypothetical protein
MLLRLTGVPTTEVGYTSATAGRGDHKVHKGHVVALEKKKIFFSEKFLILRRIYRDIINVHVKCPPFFSDFNETRISVRELK